MIRTSLPQKLGKGRWCAILACLRSWLLVTPVRPQLWAASEGRRLAGTWHFLILPRRDISGAPWGRLLSSWALAFSCLWPSGTQSHGESAPLAWIQHLGTVWWRSGGKAWSKGLSAHQSSPRNLIDFPFKASSEILGCFWPLLASWVGEAAVYIWRKGVDPFHNRWASQTTRA